MQIQCPICHEWFESAGDICPLCGASLAGKDHGSHKDKDKSKKSFYQLKSFWIFGLVCVLFAVCLFFSHAAETDPKKTFIKKQKEMIEKLDEGSKHDKISMLRDEYASFIESANPECLWYFENIPRRLSRYSSVVEDKLFKAILKKHQNDKCTGGIGDNVLSSWHIGENDKHEQICYTYSLHPPKDTAEYEPGLFRLSIVIDSCDFKIESMSSFTPGFPPLKENKLFTCYITYDKETDIDSVVIDNYYKNDFDFDESYLKKGKYMHMILPVWRSDYAMDENIFFYAYRIFPLEGMQICGKICGLK